MLISEIVRVAKDRTGEQDPVYLLAEINRAWKKMWFTIDAGPEALQELDFQVDNNNKAVLPWYVFQEKAIKLGDCNRVELYHARPYFQDDSYQQSPYEIRTLHRTPLLRMIENAGRITFRPRKALPSPVTITVKGPGEFGTTQWEDLTLGANALSVQTTGVYYDFSTLSKSTLTSYDIQAYDIQDNVVAIIPAAQTDVWNKLIQVFDRRTNAAVTNSVYTLLYKPHPIPFTRETDAVPDEYGLVVQGIVIGDIIGKSKDRESQQLSMKASAGAGVFLSGVVRKENEGKSNDVDLGVSPYYHAHCGYL